MFEWLRNVTLSYDNTDPSFPNAFKFKCAVTDSKGPRRFMEDAHSIVVPYAGVRGQGFFAIFDGHAGKQAAEWCGQNFSMVRSLVFQSHSLPSYSSTIPLPQVILVLTCIGPLLSVYCARVRHPIVRPPFSASSKPCAEITMGPVSQIPSMKLSTTSIQLSPA